MDFLSDQILIPIWWRCGFFYQIRSSFLGNEWGIFYQEKRYGSCLTNGCTEELILELFLEFGLIRVAIGCL